VSQIVAQRTKVNPWEFVGTKLAIMSFVVPNSKYLALLVDLILDLEYTPLNQSVFLLTLKSGLLNPIYYLTCPQEYIYHLWASSTPQQTCPPTPSNYWDFTPKCQILSPGGCPDACKLLYSSKALLLCQRQPAQAPWWASKAAHSQ